MNDIVTFAGKAAIELEYRMDDRRVRTHNTVNDWNRRWNRLGELKPARSQTVIQCDFLPLSSFVVPSSEREL